MAYSKHTCLLTTIMVLLTKIIPWHQFPFKYWFLSAVQSFGQSWKQNNTCTHINKPYVLIRWPLNLQGAYLPEVFPKKIESCIEMNANQFPFSWQVLRLNVRNSFRKLTISRVAVQKTVGCGSTSFPKQPTSETSTFFKQLPPCTFELGHFKYGIGKQMPTLNQAISNAVFSISYWDLLVIVTES